jgi:hypothetical protein
VAQLSEKILTSTWTKVDWDNYITAIESPDRENTKGYYYNSYMRIEDSFIGTDVARIKPLIYFAILLFGMAKEIPISGLINCSYSQPSCRNFQHYY